MIETERLILRQWKESDSEPFIKMGLDEDVMRFFPKLGRVKLEVRHKPPN